MTIRYDLSTTFQPFPEPVPSRRNAPTSVDELGALLVRRSVTPHSSSAPGATGRMHLARPGSMFTATNGIHAAHETVARWRGEDGIIRLVPDDAALAAYNGVAEDVGLLNGFRLPMENLLQQDRTKTLVMSAPNGISGRTAILQEVVRLARHFRLLVIDERLAAFTLRRMNPLVLEWENIIFVQRFPFQMPGVGDDFAWFVSPPQLRRHIAEHTTPVAQATVNAALRAGPVNTSSAERKTSRLKSQLFRELRKLSLVSVPYPSWSNSLLVRVERGDRDEIVTKLAERGILVYSPPHPNLKQHFRVTAVSTEATMALRQALVDINLEIP